MTFAITSPAFRSDSEIPSLYTCEGRNISPPLQWADLPEGTRSLVLIVDDPDAPDPAHPKTTWVHWVVYNIPPSLGGFREGFRQVPEPAEVGANSWNRQEYGGPCPPIGRHRYFFKLYAVDGLLQRLVPGSKDQVEASMRGHVLGKAQIVGTYRKMHR